MAEINGTHIEITRVAGTVEIRSNGEPLAESKLALVLMEDGYPPRYYIPAMDVRTERLLPSETRTHCPHKGDAEYFHYETHEGLLTDIAWTYPDPGGTVHDIAGHIAFHQEELDPVLVDGTPVDVS